MRVIGVGFGRTGTASTKLALEQLGFGPCYHMSEVIESAHRRRAWAEIFSGVRPNWDHIFDGYASTIDWPAAVYWREIVDAYPEAKVVLTVRDPQRWYDSMQRTILAQMNGPHSSFERWMRGAFGLLNPETPAFFDGLGQAVAGATFGGRTDRDHAVEVFEQHTREVQEYVSADRLLTFDVRQGWEPLCEFLEVPTPATTFPSVNDSADFRQIGQRMLLRGLVAPVAAAGAVAATGAGALALRAVRRRRNAADPTG